MQQKQIGVLQSQQINSKIREFFFIKMIKVSWAKLQSTYLQTQQIYTLESNLTLPITSFFSNRK